MLLDHDLLFTLSTVYSLLSILVQGIYIHLTLIVKVSRHQLCKGYHMSVKYKCQSFLHPIGQVVMIKQLKVTKITKNSTCSVSITFKSLILRSFKKKNIFYKHYLFSPSNTNILKSFFFSQYILYSLIQILHITFIQFILIL